MKTTLWTSLITSAAILIPLVNVTADDETDEILQELTSGAPTSSVGVLEPIPTAKPASTVPRQFNYPKTSAKVSALPVTAIRNVEFRMDADASQLLVTTDRRPEYRMTESAKGRQVTLLITNSTTPSRLLRSYDTSEFKSPVGIFSIQQTTSERRPATKIVFQLREKAKPEINVSETGLNVEFPPSEKTARGRGLASAEGVTVDDDALTIEGNYTGKPIQLEIKNSDIHDVLRFIAKTSGYDLVIGDDVQGRIGTLSFDNVPWDQALAMVLQMKKLGYVKQGNVLRVATLEALKAEADEVAAHEVSQAKSEPLKTVLIPISYAKATELAPRAKSFLTARGTADTDERSNTIIIRDIEKVVERIKKLFAVLDNQPPLVSVSAKIVEMKSDFSRTLGVSLLQLSGSMSGVNFGAGSSPISGAGLELNGSPLGSSINIRAQNFADLNAKLSLAEFDNQLKILANPTITVQQNQKGSISQGVTTYYLTQTVSAGGAVTPGVTPVAATLSLNVTPIVAGDGSISMNVDVKNEIPTTGGGGTTSVDTRSVSTQVLMQSGDTAVVGGIFNNKAENKSSGIPFLMKIPILGNLFSHHEKTDNRNEVLIFLTAKLLNPDESFKRNL